MIFHIQDFVTLLAEGFLLAIPIILKRLVYFQQHVSNKLIKQYVWLPIMMCVNLNFHSILDIIKVCRRSVDPCSLGL